MVKASMSRRPSGEEDFQALPIKRSSKITDFQALPSRRSSEIADANTVAAALASFSGRGHPIDLKAPEVEDPQRAVLKRVGLSVLENSDFWQRSREEVTDAERELQELKREARLRASRCDAQLDHLARECRAEEDRRLISEKVGKELAALRREMQEKEAAENERLRHLYRGIMGGEQPSTYPAYPGSQPSSFPPVITSEPSDLMQEEHTVQDKGSHLFDRLDANGNGYPSREEFSKLGEVKFDAVLTGHSKHRRKKKVAYDPEEDEARRMLKLNQARLSRLERYGL